IVETIRRRAEERPRDERLRDQLALAEAAQISTIHSFCLWAVRRWFSHLGIDPTATVLDADEASLLKKEVLDGLFSNLYASAPATGNILGADTIGDAAVGAVATAERSDRATDKLGESFARLVDVYGLGEDRDIAAFVLRLYEFTTSLPDPRRWLADAVDSLTEHPEKVIEALASELRAELRSQREHCEALAAGLEAGDPAGHYHADRIHDYVKQLTEWGRSLGQEADFAGERFERLREGIGGFDFGKHRAPNLPKGTPDAEKTARKAASDLFSKQVKKRLFGERLRERYGLFSVGEWIDGMARVAPYVATLVDLVHAFRQAYDARKRRMNVLDFSDLERCAFDLLCAPPTPPLEKGGIKGGREQPSEVARALQNRFTHVLVDEFQDINPIQQAILHLVSHESDPRRAGNLFVVGDVKQSIYRFRLAEPNLFLDRLARFRGDGSNMENARGESVPQVWRPGLPAQNERGEAVFLQSNFRSRPEILDAVNLVFRQLMPRRAETGGGVVYDEQAELRPGRTFVGNQFPRSNDLGHPTSHIPVEFHLLERNLKGASAESATDADDKNDADESDGERDDSPGAPGDDAPANRGQDWLDRGVVDPADAVRWDPIEREAYLIATHIRNLTGGDNSPVAHAHDSEVNPPESPLGKGGGVPVADAPGSDCSGVAPVRYRDIVVLLRATKINADRMAGILTAMGIPAYAEVSGSLFGALEVRDVLAALQVLDNLQQDIPLAAVLRSGLFGERFTEDDLVEFRLIDREVPFHAAVREYAHRGDKAQLRSRLAGLFARIDRYREDVRRRPLADTIWNLYERQGYLAYALGLPHGAQRRANLLKLHDLARKFGSFRRQGLHRFLRFIESMADEDRDVGAAPAIGEADDVVRIMSIHHAKGLEFPVVFVAGLGTQFNLGDRAGRMIFERKAKIGLRVVETDRMIEYPSAVHQLVASEIERSTRDEELRILYVAMTRARDRLILVGSINRLDRLQASQTAGAIARPPTRLSVATARTPLDWLLPALVGAPPGAVGGLCGDGVDPPVSPLGKGGRRGVSAPGKGENRPLVTVALHGPDEMLRWRIAQAADERENAVRHVVARLGPLPSDEPLADADSEVERVLMRMRGLYPWLSASSVRATVAASEFKGAFDYLRDPDVRPASSVSRGVITDDVFDEAAARRDTAAQRGVLTHRVLQHLDFQQAVSAAGVASELQRMIAGRVLTAAERELVAQDAIAWFVTTPLAEAIRRAGSAYRRELRFVTTEPLKYFDPLVTAPKDDRVLVRGIVDGILPIYEGVEVVDFKTDAVSEDEVPARCELYRPQMALYSRAVERLWRRPVRRCWLVFLTPRQVLSLESLTDREGLRHAH
ncbi:MAG: UvrD-helicase domain-containing protein, partial [Phycisphaerales bacterium]|nr:UvrD-helicase domain-containing protein [Phycisphaerales bacterium]